MAEQSDSDKVAQAILAKAQAYDDLVKWLQPYSLAEWTSAMSPEWVVRVFKGQIDSLLQDGLSYRNGKTKRPNPLRRMGW